MVFENFITFMNKIMLFSGYINKASSFPKTLTPEEERYYLTRLSENDEKAKEILISHNLRLVSHIVKKYSNAGEAEDLISAGSIGLIKAINTFSLDKKTQLSTYAARCIENEILMLIRVNKKHKNTMSLGESLGCDKDGNEICLMDIIPNEEQDIIEDVENKIVTKQLLDLIKDTLTNREYDIICMRYGLNNEVALTQREVAQKLGISRSYISRLETKALNDIKAKLIHNNLFINWLKNVKLLIC